MLSLVKIQEMLCVESLRDGGAERTAKFKWQRHQPRTGWLWHAGHAGRWMRRNQAKGFVWGGTLSGRLKEEKARLLRALRELPGLDSAWFQADSATDADRSPDGLCGACGRCQCGRTLCI